MNIKLTVFNTNAIGVSGPLQFFNAFLCDKKKADRRPGNNLNT